MSESPDLRILADEKLPLAIGILLTNSDVELEDCEIGGAQTGIEIRGTGRPVLRANSVHDSAGSGILISGDSTPWLSHNDIVRNGRNAREPHPGILVSGAARPVLVGNVFSENGAQGIVIPQGMDSAPILKFNFFPSGEPIGHAQPEAARRIAETTQAAAVIPVNRKIGNFEIIRKLARGGMADVYLGRDEESDRTIALKIIEHGSDPDTLDSIEAERRGSALQASLAAIDSRVVQIYSAGDADDYFYVCHGVHRG